MPGTKPFHLHHDEYEQGVI